MLCVQIFITLTGHCLDWPRSPFLWTDHSKYTFEGTKCSCGNVVSDRLMDELAIQVAAKAFVLRKYIRDVDEDLQSNF